MPKYRVHGAARDTAEDVSFEIEATDAKAAATKAIERFNMYVERVDDPRYRLPHVSFDVDHAEMRASVALGWLGQLAHRYIRLWQRSRVITGLVHLSIILAAGWLLTATGGHIPFLARGRFPPLDRVTTILNEAGYHRTATRPSIKTIRGRQLQSTEFSIDASTDVGLIDIYTDLSDDNQVIGLQSMYEHLAPFDDLALTHRGDPKLIAHHRTRLSKVIRALAAPPPEPQAFVFKPASSTGAPIVTWLDRRRTNGFAIETLRASTIPASRDVSEPRIRLLLDATFASDMEESDPEYAKLTATQNAVEFPDIVKAVVRRLSHFGYYVVGDPQDLVEPDAPCALSGECFLAANDHAGSVWKFSTVGKQTISFTADIGPTCDQANPASALAEWNQVLRHIMDDECLLETENQINSVLVEHGGLSLGDCGEFFLQVATENPSRESPFCVLGVRAQWNDD